MTEPKSEVAGVVERFLDAVSREDRQGIRAHHAQDVLMFDFPNTVRGMAEYTPPFDPGRADGTRPPGQRSIQ